MRELILAMTMSLDGFVSGPEGETDWIFDGDQKAIAWKLEAIDNAGLHIMGSRTFLGMAAFWPTSTNVFAPPMNRLPKAVFSRQGPAILSKAFQPAALGEAGTGTRSPVRQQPGANTWAEAYVATGDLADDIATLKAQDGKPVIAHGGAAFARSLVAQNLIDQYRLLVHRSFSAEACPSSLTSFHRGASS